MFQVKSQSRARKLNRKQELVINKKLVISGNFKAVSLWGRVGEMLVFGERGKPEYPEKYLSEQGREPANSAHMRYRIGESNPGHIGRRVLSPLRHPYSLLCGFMSLLIGWNVIVSSKKPITREKTKPQTVTVISLWFHVTSDWLECYCLK